MFRPRGTDGFSSLFRLVGRTFLWLFFRRLFVLKPRGPPVERGGLCGAGVGIFLGKARRLFPADSQVFFFPFFWGGNVVFES